MLSYSRFILATLFLAPVVASQSSQAAQFEKLNVGFEGVGKVGKWLPISATVSGIEPGGTVELNAAFSDPTGDRCVFTVDHAIADQSGKAQLSGRLQVGRLRGTGSIRAVRADSQAVLVNQQITHSEEQASADSETTLQTHLQLYKLSTQLLLHVGDVAGIPELVRNVAAHSTMRGPILSAVAVGSLETIPSESDIFDAIDFILITDDIEASEDHADAIRNWVRSGGRLIASSATEVGRFSATPIGQWIDELFDLSDAPIVIRDMASVQSFVPGAKSLLTGRDPWPLAVINSDQLEVEIDSLNGPVMGSRSYGGGVVTFAAVDLNRRPIDNWKSLPDFYETLLLGDRLTSDSANKKSSRISQSGVSDIATQMLSAVDAKPPRGEWSAWSVMGIIVGYLLLIGPFDYLLVNRLLKRPHLTWITFPVMVIAGSVAILNATGSDETRTLHQLDILDVCVDDNQSVIARTWLSLSSSQSERIDISAGPEKLFAETTAEQTPTDLTWSGRPEDVYGGMYREGGIGLGRQDYRKRFDEKAELQAVPMLPNGSRGLHAVWSADLEGAPVTSSLFASGFGLLKGSFEHHLPFEISDWLVVHGQRVYRLRPNAAERKLAPAESIDLGEELYASDLKAFLNGARKVSDAAKRNDSSNRGRTMVATPYDSRSRDENYILTMASFYEAAGGADYAGLSQSLLNDMELSDTIRLNHAILLGRIDEPATAVRVNGSEVEPNVSNTFVRIFLPVDRRPSEARAKTREELEDNEN